MPDNQSSGADGIVEGEAPGFVVGVPHPGKSEYVSYLRLGHASAADETNLRQDPAADASSPTLIGHHGTISPFNDGQLAYTTGTVQLVAPHSYLRLGHATAYESWLPTAHVDAAVTPGGGAATSFRDDGAVLYSNDTLNVYSPKINEWSEDKLAVSRSGSKLTATNTTGEWHRTIKTAHELNATIGSTTNLVTGNQMTQWLGNYTSFGTGGRLSGNIGFTQDLYMGQQVGLFNQSIAVKRATGELRVAAERSESAYTSYTLAVTPSAAIVNTFKRGGAIAMFVNACAAAAQDAIDIAITSSGVADKLDNDDTRDALNKAAKEIAAASAAMLLTQAWLVVQGLIAYGVARLAKKASPSRITMTEDDITLRSNGALINVSAEGLLLMASPNGLLIVNADLTNLDTL